ncbi:hypothetical protein V6N13_049435 [Hibiscus sabdariffa]
MSCKEESEVFRPIATFSQNIWRDQFPPTDDLVFYSLTKEIYPLKEKVKGMLMASAADPIHNVQFIDTLLRLGVSYHFENDIENQLDSIFSSHQNDLFSGNDLDLNSTSIVFRVFRQYGFKMSCAEETRKDGRSYAVPFAKDALIQLANDYQAEVKWYHDSSVPTFEEYMRVAMKTSTFDVLLTIAFIGMGEVAGIQAFEWLRNDPKILKATNVIGRLMDDIVSHKVYIQRKTSLP